MDLLRWLISEHPKLFLTLVAAWFGLGWLGRSWQASMKLAKSWPLLLVPAAVIWLAARRYRGGRRGLAIAAPWLLAIVWSVAFLAVPAWRVALLGPPLFIAVGSGIVAFDSWLGHQEWTWAAIRRTWYLGDARTAFRAGVLVATEGAGGKVTAVRVEPDGRTAVDVRVPSGHSVRDLEKAADDGRFGAAANTYGIRLGDVKVERHEDQGSATVYGRIAGVDEYVHQLFPYPY